jgi:D-alanyl-D-alanine carboxypeptidase/D-alanyl-D-alanine-endopeptidase (penicillin-binding protein 4)
MTRNAALLLALAAFSASQGARAETPLEARVRAVLGKPELAGSRWGVRVEDHEGHVLVSDQP